MATEEDYKKYRAAVAYNRTLVRVEGRFLDELAGELGTGRWPGERDDQLRARLVMVLPHDVGWVDRGYPIIQKYTPRPARRVGPTYWEHLLETD